MANTGHIYPEFKNSIFKSIGIHLGMILGVPLVLMGYDALLSQKKMRNNFEEVVFMPTPSIQKNIQQPIDTKPKVEKRDQKRSVFGVKRNSLTGPANASNPVVKQGNTTAKAEDQLKLKNSDADEIPIPTASYLVNEMPKLKREVKIPYPPQSRQNGLEGAVLMDLIIDQQGRVRDAKVIQSPAQDLADAAKTAAYQFEFSPARIGDNPVAVRIRYSYRFILE